MKLLCIDYPECYAPADSVEFSSDTSCYDYDVVIWDPGGSLWHYTGSDSYMGLHSLSDYYSVQVMADISRRRKEFLELINSGRMLIVIARPPQKFYYATGSKSYSGTGRNRSTTRHVAEGDILDAFPADITLTAASGKNIQLVGEGGLQALLRKHSAFMRYAAVMENAPGTTIAKIANTDRIVGTMLSSKNGGALVTIPSMDFPEHDEDDEDDDTVLGSYTFQTDLLAWASERVGSKEALPDWASRYLVTGESATKASILTQEKAIARAKTKLETSQDDLRQIEEKKQLFTGTGRQLELEVRKVLELLGGIVEEPEPGRDDWIVKFPEGVAVVEVKGVSKSAAEKHAAQLEKWVANYLEAEGVLPKGILVVNTWRQKPLDERTEDSFPKQMLSYSKARNHCLVTGLQFLGIRETIEKDPSQKQKLRKQLLKQSGIFTDFDDYKMFIESEATNTEVVDDTGEDGGKSK